MQFGKLNLFTIIFRNIAFYIIIVLFILAWGCLVGNILSFTVSNKFVIKYIIWGGNALRRIFQLTIGVKVKVFGLEHIVKGQPMIVASKHQSFFETSLLFDKWFHKLAHVHKEEVKKQFFYFRPMYNIFTKVVGICLDRRKGIKSLIDLEKQGLEKLNQGYSVLIFPEGTRVPIGEEAELKKGLVRIYSKANVKVVPVALTTGVCWPKDRRLMYPGIISVRFLDPILPGLSNDDFIKELQERINHGSKQLLKETPCNYYMHDKGLC